MAKSIVIYNGISISKTKAFPILKSKYRTENGKIKKFSKIYSFPTQKILRLNPPSTLCL